MKEYYKQQTDRSRSAVGSKRGEERLYRVIKERLCDQKNEVNITPTKLEDPKLSINSIVHQYKQKMKKPIAQIDLFVLSQNDKLAEQQREQNKSMMPLILSSIQMYNDLNSKKIEQKNNITIRMRTFSPCKNRQQLSRDYLQTLTWKQESNIETSSHPDQESQTPSQILSLLNPYECETQTSTYAKNYYQQQQKEDQSQSLMGQNLTYCKDLSPLSSVPHEHQKIEQQFQQESYNQQVNIIAKKKSLDTPQSEINQLNQSLISKQFQQSNSYSNSRFFEINRDQLGQKREGVSPIKQFYTYEQAISPNIHSKPNSEGKSTDPSKIRVNSPQTLRSQSKIQSEESESSENLRTMKNQFISQIKGLTNSSRNSSCTRKSLKQEEKLEFSLNEEYKSNFISIKKHYSFKKYNVQKNRDQQPLTFDHDISNLQFVELDKQLQNHSILVYNNHRIHSFKNKITQDSPNLIDNVQVTPRHFKNHRKSNYEGSWKKQFKEGEMNLNEIISQKQQTWRYNFIGLPAFASPNKKQSEQFKPLSVEIKEFENYGIDTYIQENRHKI